MLTMALIICGDLAAIYEEENYGELRRDLDSVGFMFNLKFEHTPCRHRVSLER